MTDHDDLEARVTALEEQALHTRHDVAAARILAGGADRDVADFRRILTGHTKVLNAMRENQIEHGQRLNIVEREVREGFAETKIGLAEAKADVAEVKADVAGLKTDVAGLKTDVAGLKTNVGGLKTDVAETKADVAEIKGTLTTVNIGMGQIATLLQRVIDKD